MLQLLLYNIFCLLEGREEIRKYIYKILYLKPLFLVLIVIPCGWRSEIIPFHPSDTLYYFLSCSPTSKECLVFIL